MKVGPAANQLFGFDLVVFDGCVEFAMEHCERIEDLSEETEHQLKVKLFDLHSLSLVHMDIKTANLCLSPSLKQPVFIDFGLSEIVQQSAGAQTLTRFAGTLNYCCPEMLKLYNNGEGFVDLFHNDVYCF